MAGTPLDRLWEPVEIGPVTVPNRIAYGPATLLYAERNVLSDRHIAYHAERARGGSGLIVTEEHAAFDRALGSFPDACTAWEQRAVPMLAKLAEAVHEHGTRLFLQLWGAGVADSGTVLADRWQPVMGPSRTPSPLKGAAPFAMGPAEIEEVVRGHGETARNAEVAGLDGVEVHAAHGWLLAQFLSPLYNRRADPYGGSVRRRARLLLEVLAAIRAQAPALAVGVQLSVDEHVGEHGITPEQALEQVELLAASGLVDYVNVSTGSQYSQHLTIPASEAPEAMLAEHGRAIKRQLGSRAKVLLVATVRSVSTAAELVASDAADLVAMTRAHIADPFLVRKAREGRAEETIPCVGENECILRTRLARPVACMMNPASGNEVRWGTEARAAMPAAEPQRVAIVGGGPAGLAAAATLADRGHHVVLWEREQQPGGHMELLARMPGRERWRLGARALAAAAERAGAELRLGVEATAARIADHSPDLVLCATGADWDRTGVSAGRPGRAPLPGADGEHVLGLAEAARRAQDAPAATRPLGERVLIVDETGDYLPLGLADLLAAAGAQVLIATRYEEAFANVRGSLDGHEAFARLATAGAEIWTGLMPASIGESSVHFSEVWSGRERSAERIDTVVLAIERVPADELHLALLDAGVASRALGDALTPRRTAEVIREAHELALAVGTDAWSPSTG